MSKSTLKVLVILAVFLVSTMLPSIPIVRAQRDDYWISRAPLNHIVSFPTVIAVNNKIYAISPSLMEEYNPETNTWTSKTPMPTPRAHFAIVAYQNKIYCIGGAIDYKVDETSGFYSSIVSGITGYNADDPLTHTDAAKFGLIFQMSIIPMIIFIIGTLAFIFMY